MYASLGMQREHMDFQSMHQQYHHTFLSLQSNHSCQLPSVQTSNICFELEVLARMTPGIRDFVPDDVSPQEWWQSGPDIS